MKTASVFPTSQQLSRAFHNWFYAGWVVVDNDWAKIAPKSVRSEWEPIVSTEEFEKGLAILAKRNNKPEPKKKYFYLLQGLVYLEYPDGKAAEADLRHAEQQTAHPAAYRTTAFPAATRTSCVARWIARFPIICVLCN